MSRVDRQVADQKARRVAERDAHTEAVFAAIEAWDVDEECPHYHLPGDPPPHRCDCWKDFTVTEAAAIRMEVQAVAAELKRSHEELAAAVRALTEVLAHVDRNVTAVGFQVSENGR